MDSTTNGSENQDDAYTNLDLDTAEEMVIAAGKPELAKALRYQAQGVRNLVQGEWGGAFVKTLENIMDTRVISVLTSVQQRLDQQYDIVQQLLAMQKASDKTAKQALSVAKAGAARLKKLEMGQKKYNTRLDDVIKRLEADEERLDKKRERIDRLEFEVGELKAWVTGLPTPEESKRLITLLERIAAERGGDANG
jgi:DNA repair ATPase RecN